MWSENKSSQVFGYFNDVRSTVPMYYFFITEILSRQKLSPQIWRVCMHEESTGGMKPCGICEAHAAKHARFCNLMRVVWGANRKYAAVISFLSSCICRALSRGLVVKGTCDLANSSD